MHRTLKRFTAASTLLAAGTVLLAQGAAWANDPIGGAGFIDDKGANFGNAIDKSGAAVNLLWIVLGAVLVIFMQAGFALVETGFCRAKHAAHVVSTNFAIFGLGFVSYFLVGFSFMFGGYSATIGKDAAPVIGKGIYTTAFGHAVLGHGSTALLWWGGFGPANPKIYDVGILAFFLYMVAFMDTTATIPTGAMAERWKWSSFVSWGVFCGAIYYPLFGAWTWGGGWLSQLGNSHGWGHGYVDFAGSGVVHAMGGIAALTGAIVLGPRLGKYGKDGSVNTLSAHHIPMALLGCFILLFGWFGFNAASTFAATDPRFTVVAANTALAAAFGATTAMAWVWIRAGKPDPAMMVNGMLAGLVGITAPCAFVSPGGATLIGIFCGVFVIEAVWFIDRKLKIDDPVGAISVHGVCGIIGVLSVGLLADGNYGAGWNATDNALADPVGTGVKGLFYGGGFGQLWSQMAGAFVIVFVFGGLSLAFWKTTDKLWKGGIRSNEADEIAGIDLPEMGVLAYPAFTGDGMETPLPPAAPKPATKPATKAKPLAPTEVG